MTINEIILLVAVLLIAALSIFFLINLKGKDLKMVQEEKYFNETTNTFTYKGFIWKLGQAKTKHSVVAMELQFSDGSNGFSSEIEGFVKKISKAARDELGPCIVGHYNLNYFLFAIPSIDSSNILSRMENLKNKIMSLNLTFVKLLIIYGICGEPGTPAKQVEKAHFALKFAKRKQMNAVYFDERVFKMQNNFSRILNNPNLISDEFAVYYQPIVRATNNEFVAAEAKIRWIGENGQVLYYPREFVEEFTNNGFITQIDLFAFESVCSFLESLRKRGIRPVTISVNVAAIDLLNPFFIENVRMISQKYDFDKSYVHLLIANCGTFDDQKRIERALQQIKELEIVCEANDFGNNALVDQIANPIFTIFKLDRAFSKNHLRTPNDQIVFKSLVDMIERTGKTCIIKSIESTDVAEVARKCSKKVLLQGNFLHQPLPVNNFETLLQGNRFLTSKNFGAAPTIETVENEIEIEPLPEYKPEPEPTPVVVEKAPEPVKPVEVAPVEVTPVTVEPVKPTIKIEEAKPELVIEEIEVPGQTQQAPAKAPEEPQEEEDEEFEDDIEYNEEDAEDNESEEEKIAQLMLLYKKEFQDKWEQEMLRKYPELMKKHYARRKFYERVINLSPDNKKYYNIIKNKIMSYTEMTNATTNYFDTFINKRRIICKIAIVGKSIKLYLALNPNNYPVGQFPHKDVSDVKRHEKTPYVMKLSSNLAIRRANILIDDLARINQISPKPDFKEKDFVKSMQVNFNKKK